MNDILYYYHYYLHEHLFSFWLELFGGRRKKKRSSIVSITLFLYIVYTIPFYHYLQLCFNTAAGDCILFCCHWCNNSHTPTHRFCTSHTYIPLFSRSLRIQTPLLHIT